VGVRERLIRWAEAAMGKVLREVLFFPFRSARRFAMRDLWYYRRAKTMEGVRRGASQIARVTRWSARRSARHNKVFSRSAGLWFR
jgi:hypothetical protein